MAVNKSPPASTEGGKGRSPQKKKIVITISSGSGFEVTGSTYEVRDVLKNYNFTWTGFGWKDKCINKVGHVLDLTMWYSDFRRMLLARATAIEVVLRRVVQERGLDLEIVNAVTYAVKKHFGEDPPSLTPEEAEQVLRAPCPKIVSIHPLQMFKVYGDTYEIRDILKEMGFKYSLGSWHKPEARNYILDNVVSRYGIIHSFLDEVKQVIREALETARTLTERARQRGIDLLAYVVVEYPSELECYGLWPPDRAETKSTHHNRLWTPFGWVQCV